MTNQEVEARFNEDTKDHTMEIIYQGDGVRRHLMFSNNGSSCYRYDIHTWPGYLMVTGDMGTYVFRRINDMFEFFTPSSSNNPEYRINTGYWAEKLEAIDSHCGGDASIKEYKSEKFREMIKEEFDQWVEGWEIEQEEADEVWEELKDEVLCYEDDEQPAYHAAYSYQHGNLNFYDSSFGSCREYNYHFRWILYAIVDGIEQFNEYNKQKAGK